MSFGIPLVALTGCADDEVEPSSPVAGAISACLTAAQEQSQLELPADDGDGLDISVDVDSQGWWAVVAATRGADPKLTLTCTAVPDGGPLGARAASWSVAEG
ncbi:hypothetical protein CBP52_12260 [Cellulomonas sp. PSBB021]|nr:hypothetical protein CBP52_12260 [Cellulomonas sp. PSBB021]